MVPQLLIQPRIDRLGARAAIGELKSRVIPPVHARRQRRDVSDTGIQPLSSTLQHGNGTWPLKEDCFPLCQWVSLPLLLEGGHVMFRISNQYKFYRSSQTTIGHPLTAKGL